MAFYFAATLAIVFFSLWFLFEWAMSGLTFGAFLVSLFWRFLGILFPPKYQERPSVEHPVKQHPVKQHPVKQHPVKHPSESPTWRSYVPFGVGNTIADFLIDPDKKYFEIFVAPGVLSKKDSKWIVLGRETYEDKSSDGKVKLKASGTGFIVYDHPDIPAGTWASCR